MLADPKSRICVQRIAQYFNTRCCGTWPAVRRLVSYFFYVRAAMRLRLAMELLLLAAWTSLVVGTHEWYSARFISVVHSGENILAMTGTLLFFLTTFRARQSYGRWWEGRIIWGKFLGATFNLTQQAVQWVGDRVLVERITRYSIAFAYASKHLLRDDTRELQRDELKQVRAAPMRPTAT